MPQLIDPLFEKKSQEDFKEEWVKRVGFQYSLPNQFVRSFLLQINLTDLEIASHPSLKSLKKAIFEKIRFFLESKR